MRLPTSLRQAWWAGLRKMNTSFSTSRCAARLGVPSPSSLAEGNPRRQSLPAAALALALAARLAPCSIITRFMARADADEDEPAKYVGSKSKRTGEA